MKQVLQNLGSGETLLADVPCPALQAHSLLIATQRSLISAGTERMLVDFGRSNWLQKAKQQPDKVRMVLEKIKTDGVVTTLEAVRSKLDQPIALGYCNVGRIVEVGEKVSDFSLGDRVLSNGAHAEIARVNQALAVKIPDAVDDDSAAFTVIGAIALQGIRLAQPTLGESVVVIGLGLIGLLTVQLLRAQGCRVLGVDFDSKRCQLAKQLGAETVVDLSQQQDLLVEAERFSAGHGVDAVLITASTASHEPMHQAATISRKRGRIILVGVTGLNLNRADFYQKELSFQVSCSYGPGRYDPAYEDQGLDYPLPYVRWTERRNFEAILQLMANGQLDVTPLITHRVDFIKAVEAYDLLAQQRDALGILLDYPQKTVPLTRTVALTSSSIIAENKSLVCAVLGAGNYASRVLIPALKKTTAQLHTWVSSAGISAVHHGKKLGFQFASTDENSVYQNSEVNCVFIATRHDMHATQVCQALRAGQHVFVEKPLALNLDELSAIQSQIFANQSQVNDRCLMIGFNRRFAPMIMKMKQLLVTQSAPKSLIVTVNAGSIAADHWTQDVHVGGGRIIGEACHFIDLVRFLVGQPFQSVHAQRLSDAQDTVTIDFTFTDGSIATVHYFANGAKSFAKERLEVFCSGKILQMDNYRKLTGYGYGSFKGMRAWRQDKGQQACVQAFVNTITAGGAAPIPFDEIVEVSHLSIVIAEGLRKQSVFAYPCFNA